MCVCCVCEGGDGVRFLGGELAVEGFSCGV